MVIYAMWIGIK